MKAADLDRDDVLRAVYRINVGEERWAMVGELEAAFPAAPGKVVVAKLRKLIRQGFLTGCTCGCRGDFELTEKGLREVPL